jgi:hypothetical protein
VTSLLGQCIIGDWLRVVVEWWVEFEVSICYTTLVLCCSTYLDQYSIGRCSFYRLTLCMLATGKVNANIIDTSPSVCFACCANSKFVRVWWTIWLPKDTRYNMLLCIIYTTLHYINSSIRNIITLGWSTWVWIQGKAGIFVFSTTPIARLTTQPPIQWPPKAVYQEDIADGAWGMPPTSIQCRRQECEELCISAPWTPAWQLRTLKATA